MVSQLSLWQIYNSIFGAFMNNFIFILLAFFSLVYSNGFYADCGTRGVGIGYDKNIKFISFHTGAYLFPEYQYGFKYFDADTSSRHFMKITTYPYLGFSTKIPLSNTIFLRPYFDGILGFSVAHENVKHKGNAVWDPKIPTSNTFFEYLEQYSFRTGIGLFFTNWKLPMGVSLDAYYLFFAKNHIELEVSPRLIIFI